MGLFDGISGNQGGGGGGFGISQLRPSRYLSNLQSGLAGLGRGITRSNNEFRDVDQDGNLANQSGLAGGFADESQIRYGQTGDQMQSVADRLGRVATGEESVSREQLRQSLGQNLAQQQAMQAGARPGNQAMAARQASMNAMRGGMNLSGQQALAGIMERQAADQSLGNLLGGMRGQDLQAALGGRGQAIQGYGDIERARGQRFGAFMGEPTGMEKGFSMGAGLLAGVGLSDRRLKKEIKEDATDDAEEFLDKLTPKRYRYKDEAHGKGDYLGFMAQDAARSRLGKGVIVETDDGKGIDSWKLQSALTAGLASLHKRTKKLEGK